MKTADVKAYAKINLSLDVLGKREDGYHEMLMVMQSVSLCDDITITVTKGSGNISAETNRPYIPGDMRNLVCRAADVFLKEHGINDADVSFKVVKRIPVCAGLGGGSSDAAAVLKGLNDIFGTGMSLEAIEKLGERVGSDVPFCIRQGTAIARGVGEKLESIEPLKDCQIVICKPSFSVSTPELFAKIDSVKIKERPDTDGLVSAIRTGDLENAARRCFNVFEAALPKRPGELVAKIKNCLIECGALGASMTGTGSAVYGIFADRKSAEHAYGTLSSNYHECCISEPVVSEM